MSIVRENVVVPTKLVITEAKKVVMIKHLRTEMLDRSNYRVRRAQFAMMLRGLMEYLEGDMTLVGKLEKQQDQLTLGWMLSSISVPVLMSVMTCAMVREAWKILCDMYGSDSEMRVFNCDSGFRASRKGAVNDFIMEIAGISDQLAVAGDGATDRELVMCALSGLDEDYDSFIQNITSKEVPISYPKLVAMVSDLEVRQKNRMANSSVGTGLLVNVVATEVKREVRNVPCQICSKKGHGMLNCYLRYTDKYPLTNPCIVKSASPSPKTANLAWNCNTQWYPDSGVTNHVPPRVWECPSTFY